MTPFQCIPERVGLAATTWAIFAERQINPLKLLTATEGISGNFELVVPSSLGGLAHYYRQNNPMGSWVEPTAILGSGQDDAVTFIESNLGSTHNNFEVIARQGDRLVAFYRDGSTFTWSGPVSIASGVSGNPVLIQGNYGTAGANLAETSP